MLIKCIMKEDIVRMESKERSILTLDSLSFYGSIVYYGMVYIYITPYNLIIG